MRAAPHPVLNQEASALSRKRGKAAMPGANESIHAKIIARFVSSMPILLHRPKIEGTSVAVAPNYVLLVVRVLLAQSIASGV
jgi:hypothetical protein